MKKLSVLLLGLVILIVGCNKSTQTVENNNDKLFEAIKSKNLIAVKKIVTETDVDLDPPTQPNMVNKALAYASIYGNLDIVKFILSQGVQIDGRVAYDGTALLRAMEVGNNDIAKFLIESGADVNTPNAFGISAMIGSAILFNEELMTLIISKGGDINKAHKMTTNQGYGEYAYNPIQWAIIRQNKECVEHLISIGVSMKVISRDNETLLDLAKKSGNVEIIELIKTHS